jgi:predicted transcriptional regulator
VDSDQPVEMVTRLMAARNPAVLVRDHDQMAGILTRYDMLQFIAGGE